MARPISRTGNDAKPIGDQNLSLSIKRRQRYGTSGYERVYNTPSHQASIASAAIGKVDVDCRFLFEKSRLGLREEKPAGIVYLDLCFRQPLDHCLKAATVTVRLDDEHEDLRKERKKRIDHKHAPVEIGPHYGPGPFKGEARYASITKKFSISPEISLSQVSVKGMGMEKEVQRQEESRWKFTSYLCRDPKSKESPHVYRVLKWDLVENELEKQPLHDGTIHTAFCFQHDEQPFLMHVTIEGELKKETRNLRFGSLWSKNSTATTKIKPKGSGQSTQTLDELAKKLPLEMWQLNLRNIPPEIPNSQRGFWPQLFPCDHSSGAQDGLDQCDDDQNLDHDPLNQFIAPMMQLVDVMNTLLAHRDAQPIGRQSLLSGCSQDERQARCSRSVGVPPHTQMQHHHHHRGVSSASSTTLYGENPLTADQITIPKQLDVDSSSSNAVRGILKFTGLIRAMQHYIKIMIEGVDEVQNDPTTSDSCALPQS